MVEPTLFNGDIEFDIETIPKALQEQCLKLEELNGQETILVMHCYVTTWIMMQKVISYQETLQKSNGEQFRKDIVVINLNK